MLPYLNMRVISLIKVGDSDKESGQTLIEYALILVLIAIVIIGILTLLGENIGNIYETILNSFPNSNAYP